nr:hypothetical protein [Rhizoctonia fumigata mycovirus 2]
MLEFFSRKMGGGTTFSGGPPASIDVPAIAAAVAALIPAPVAAATVTKEEIAAAVVSALPAAAAALSASGTAVPESSAVATLKAALAAAEQKASDAVAAAAKLSDSLNAERAAAAEAAQANEAALAAAKVDAEKAAAAAVADAESRYKAELAAANQRASEAAAAADSSSFAPAAAAVFRAIQISHAIGTTGSHDNRIFTLQQAIRGNQSKHGPCLASTDLTRPFTVTYNGRLREFHIENARGPRVMTVFGEINFANQDDHVAALRMVYGLAHSVRFASTEASSSTAGVTFSEGEKSSQNTVIPPVTVSGGHKQTKLSIQDLYLPLSDNPPSVPTLDSRSGDVTIGALLHGPTNAHRTRISYPALSHLADGRPHYPVTGAAAPAGLVAAANPKAKEWLVQHSLPSTAGDRVFTDRLYSHSTLQKSKISYDTQVVGAPKGQSGEVTLKALKSRFGRVINHPDAQTQAVSFLNAWEDSPSADYSAIAERIKALDLALSMGGELQNDQFEWSGLVPTLADAGQKPAGSLNSLFADFLHIQHQQNVPIILLAVDHFPEWSDDDLMSALVVFGMIQRVRCGITDASSCAAVEHMTSWIDGLNRDLNRSMIKFVSCNDLRTAFRGAAPLNGNYNPALVTRSACNLALSLLTWIVGNEAAVVRGRGNALRRAFFSKTLSQTATSLPMHVRFVGKVGEAASRAGYRRALFYLSKNARQHVGANRFKSPAMPAHPDGAHAMEGTQDGMAARNLPASIVQAVEDAFPTAATRPAPGNLDAGVFPAATTFNRGWPSVIVDAAGSGEFCGMKSVDVAWFARFAGWDLSTYGSFKAHLARLTTAEQVDFIAWTYDLNLTNLAVAPGADELSFGARWQGGQAMDAENGIFHATAAEGITNRFGGEVRQYPPLQQVPVAGQNNDEVSLNTLAAGYFTPKHCYLPVSNFTEEAHYTVPVGLNAFKNMIFNQATAAESRSAQAFAQALATCKAPALDTFDALTLLGMRCAADAAVAEMSLTRSLVLLSQLQIDTGSSDLDELLPKSNAISSKLSLSAIEAGLLQYFADVGNAIGAEDNLFDEQAKGRVNVQLYRPFIVSSHDGADRHTLHHLPLCVPPELFEMMLPGASLLGTHMHAKSDWQRHTHSGTKNYSANFEFQDFYGGEFFAIMKKMAARAGLGYRVTAKVEYIEAQVNPSPRYVELDSVWKDLFPRKPDYSSYSDAGMVDNLQLTNYLLGVKWFEHEMEPRTPAQIADALANPACAENAPLPPIEVLSSLLDVNRRDTHLPEQCIAWGEKARDFQTPLGATYPVNLGNATTQSIGVDTDGGFWDVREVVRYERNSKGYHAHRFIFNKVWLNLARNAAGLPRSRRLVSCGMERALGSIHYGEMDEGGANWVPAAQLNLSRRAGNSYNHAALQGPRSKDTIAGTERWTSTYMVEQHANLISQFLAPLAFRYTVNYHPFANLQPFVPSEPISTKAFVEKVMQRPRDTPKKRFPTAFKPRQPRELKGTSPVTEVRDKEIDLSTREGSQPDKGTVGLSVVPETPSTQTAPTPQVQSVENGGEAVASTSKD